MRNQDQRLITFPLPLIITQHSIPSDLLQFYIVETCVSNARKTIA